MFGPEPRDDDPIRSLRNEVKQSLATKSKVSRETVRGLGVAAALIGATFGLRLIEMAVEGPSEAQAALPGATEPKDASLFSRISDALCRSGASGGMVMPVANRPWKCRALRPTTQPAGQ